MTFFPQSFLPASRGHWSPDGTEITFLSVTPGTLFGIFVVPANGGEPQLIADLPGLDNNPRWSPKRERHLGDGPGVGIVT